MKRLIDIILSAAILTITSPVIAILALAIWLQDRHNPFYLSKRIGKNGRIFIMYKLRSMVPDAEKAGIFSTSADDKRITPIGRLIRKYKLDELPQFINVLKGDMSIVGPRPNVEHDVSMYTREELLLLAVRPGITDISSIVISNEDEILKGYRDPDLAYNELIRPIKSYLGLFYIANSNIYLDIELIILTLLVIINKKLALTLLIYVLKNYNIDRSILELIKSNREVSSHKEMVNLLHDHKCNYNLIKEMACELQKKERVMCSMSERFLYGLSRGGRVLK